MSARKAQSYYTVDENFFTEIDTPEKAWVLGLFTADGHLSKGGTFRIGLLDEDVVLKVQRCFKSNHKINERTQKNGKRFYTFVFSHPRIRDDLRGLGFSSNKTFDCRLPSIPKELLPHYFRGWFEGDGTIVRSKRKRGSAKAQVRIVGTEGMCLDAAKIIGGFVYKVKENMWRLNLDRVDQAEGFLKLIYDCSADHMRMDRKYRKWKEYLEGEGYFKAKSNSVILRNVPNFSSFIKNILESESEIKPYSDQEIKLKVEEFLGVSLDNRDLAQAFRRVFPAMKTRKITYFKRFLSSCGRIGLAAAKKLGDDWGFTESSIRHLITRHSELKVVVA